MTTQLGKHLTNFSECLRSVMAKNQGLTRQLERGCVDIFSQYKEVQGIHPMDYEQALPSIQAVIPDEPCLKRRKIELGLLSGNIAKLECILDGKMLANELEVVNEDGKMTNHLAFSSSDTGDMVSLLVEQNDIQNFFETIGTLLRAQSLLSGFCKFINRVATKL